MEAKKVKVNNIEYPIKVRSNGTLEVRVWNPFQKKQCSVYAKNTTELKRKIRDKIIANAQQVINPTNDTVEQYITKWLYTYKIKAVKRSTFDINEKMFLRYIKPLIGKKKFKDVTDTDLQNILNKTSETKAFSTVKKVKETINQCWKFAYDRKDIEKDLLLTLKMPKESMCGKKTKEMNVYSESDIKNMYDAIIYYYKKKHYYRISPIFIFLVNTGLRIGEALALKFDDIDLENKTVTINKTLSRVKIREDLQEDDERSYEYIITEPKTYTSNRVVDLNNTAIWALKEIERRNKEQGIIKSEFVFSSELGNFFNPRSIEDTMKRICNRAGIEYYGLHSLRHTFASRCFQKGIQVEIVSKILGHASPSITTKVYIHIMPHMKRNAVLALDDGLIDDNSELEELIAS